MSRGPMLVKQDLATFALTLAAMLLGTPTHADAPAAEPIQPDRPGIADGSLVIGARHFQIEAGVQGQDQSTGDQDARALFTPTLLRLGIEEHWEARLETNAYSHTHVSGPGIPTERSSGYSPISLGVKYHFRDAKESTGNLSLGTILRLFPPSGSSDFRTHHVTGDLRLAADWNLAPEWALNPNVGVAVYEDETGKSFAAGLFALTLTYAPNKRLQPYADVGLQAPEERGGRTAVLFDGGATYLLNRDTQIDFGIGTGLKGRTAPDFFWTVGLSYRFRKS
jgi:outer membrane putative beta-barrel porin/alpha-amylase